MVFKNIQEYCEKNKISVAAFERICGLGNGCVSKWEDDKCKPTLESLQKIAKATGIPVQRWIG